MASHVQGTVYLLHFTVPVGTERKRASHYLGWALDLDKRLAEHRSGRGGKLPAAAVRAGAELQVVRTWPGDRFLERKLKSQHDRIGLCPTCTPNAGVGKGRYPRRKKGVQPSAQ